MIARARLVAIETTALVVVAVLLGALGTWTSREEGDGAILRPSSFLAGSSGLKALYLAAEALGIPVDRWMLPLPAGGGGAPASAAQARPGFLAIVSPTEPLTRAEAAGLREWVEAGGRLLYVPSAGAAEDAFLAALGLGLLDPAGRERQAPLLGLAPPPPAREEEASARPDPRGSRGEPASPAARRLVEGTPEQVDGFPYLLDLRGSLADGAEVLLASGASLVAGAYLTLGSGEVALFSHPRPLLNDRIGRSGAAPLALRALAQLAGDGTAWFDEFHHGFDGRGSLERATLRFLATTAAGWGILQLVLLAAAAVFFAGVRLGKASPPPPARARSSLEHVRALAAAYLAAGARARPARLIVEGMRLRLGAATREALQEKLEVLARRRPALRTAVAEVGAALEPRAPSKASDLVRTAAAADRLLAALGEIQVAGAGTEAGTGGKEGPGATLG